MKEDNREMYLEKIGENTARLATRMQPQDTEAPSVLSSLLDNALLTGNYHRVEALCRADDIPSVRLYESCGMKAEGTLREAGKNPDGTYCDLLLFSILEGERRKQEENRKREEAAALYREKYQGFFIRRLKAEDRQKAAEFLSEYFPDGNEEELFSGFAVGIFDCRGTKAYLEAHAEEARLCAAAVRNGNGDISVFTDPGYASFRFESPLVWILERHAFQSGEEKDLPPDSEAFLGEEALAACAIRGCSYLIMTYDFTEKVGTHYT